MITAVLSFCCGIGFFICVAFLLAELQERRALKSEPNTESKTTPPHAWPRDCQFIIIDAQYHPRSYEDQGPMTLKLLVCKVCSQHQVAFMPGKWELETLMSKEPRVPAEIAALIRMYEK